MKNILILIIVLIAGKSFARNETYQKLIEVNKCWREQKEVLVHELVNPNLTEKEWIQLHLSLVEQTLRSRPANHLNSSQQISRSHCLDILHRYGQEANFPINEEYAYRTPIFIDKHDNFCAVGFLIKETGHEQISRKIAAQTNLAYVREMKYPELMQWADENGFTLDELAWIQPGYPPQSKCQKVGNGVDGFVQELFVDTVTQQLFVGGKFIQADKSFVANNVAYVTENTGVYTWHKMADGVNGTVNAITRFEDKIFVAGSFDKASGVSVGNVAYWDGAIWHNAGCIDGVVNDLLVFGGKLYAAGDFKSCGSGTGNNFAQWDGSSWTIINGLKGKVNTLESYKGFIVLGGAFDYDTSIKVNAVKWNPVSSFQKFDNKLINEVMDFEVYHDTLLAACKRMIVTDTLKVLLQLNSNSWSSYLDSKPGYFGFHSTADTLSFNSLCIEGAAISIGGYFHSYNGMTSGHNSMAFGTYWVNVDSTVNKMVLFKDQFILAGKFKTGRSFNYTDGEVVELNGITSRKQWTTGVSNLNKQETKFNVYPNPVSSGKIVTIENSFFASDYYISTIDGKHCINGKLNNKNEIQLPQLAAGIYFISLLSKDGQSACSKVSVE